MLVPTTIHIIDKDTLLPLEGVVVSVWNSDYSAMAGDGITDNSGNFLLGLEPDGYRGFFAKSGYTFYPIPTTIGVGEEASLFEIEGTPVVTPAIPQGLVWLYGEVKDTSLNPLINAAVNIFLLGTPQTKNGAVLERAITTVYTDCAGKWGILLAGGTRVSVTILAGKYSKSGILPFTGSIEVNDIGLYG